MAGLCTRVTFVTPWYGSFAGGAEAATRGFAEALVQRGVDVEVLATCSKSPFDDWWIDYHAPGQYNENSVAVRRFPVNRNGKESYQNVVMKQVRGDALSIREQYDFFTYGINSESLIAYLSSADPRHPIIALPYYYALVFSLATHLPQRILLMPCFHDEPQFYWEPVERLLRSSRKIFFLSQEEKMLAIQRYGHTIGRRLVEAPVVGVGFELNEPWSGRFGAAHGSASPSQREVRSQHNLPISYFVYVGRKDVGKSISKMVAWFQTYRRQSEAYGVEPAPLVFLGGGETSLIPTEPGFVDLGWVSERDKFDLLKAATALVTLSRNESFSLVLMESWLCGTPVVVSAECPVTAGHCFRSNGGLLVRNPEEFTGALQLLQIDPKLRQQLGKQGQQYVRSRYNWDDVLERLYCGLGELAEVET